MIKMFHMLMLVLFVMSVGKAAITGVTIEGKIQSYDKEVVILKQPTGTSKVPRIFFPKEKLKLGETVKLVLTPNQFAKISGK